MPSRPRRRSTAALRRVLTCAVVGALLAACSVGATGDDQPEEPRVRIAASSDAEGELLAHVLATLVNAAGMRAEVVVFTDARDGRQAIELGVVGVRAAYTGEAWLETLGRADPPGDPEASFGPVRTHDARQGITWLPPRFASGIDGPPANATFAFVVAGPPSIDADLRTVSQLATRLGEQPEATVCVDREFGTRQDGLRAVLDAYRVSTDRPFLAATPEEAVRAVAAGDCIAGLTTATDGTAWAAGLRPLDDDLEVFPAFVVAAQARTRELEERPEIAAALVPFGELTTSLLGTWNARVVRGAPVELVAEEAATELRARAAATAEADEADADEADGE